ncbi:ABC transporter substrate-binding protein [Solirubrobacter phytolaccae]|uniref:ABC transporter substrate-binding protein n=1 Tax=Solirubrobacter phytolaccae TaxID=1404360 RepID=A0A9X3SA00_9ACTN|nr:ABC transporter substrate-binding protein [Solirubrobacter phytolaccae]MDA0183123.1 ABC transporter substrate-binding protein [Solirubrobacter phytolaccae]
MLDAEAATLSRRNLLLRAAGTATAFALPGVLAACGGDDAPTGASGGGGASGAKEAVGTVSFGSNASDPVPKEAYAKVFEAFKTATGGTVKVNTVDHNTFQEQINSYLQGKPDEVFTWFAGYRMQFFAERGLATDISDVWGEVGGNYSDALKQASTGLDGKQYFIPFYYYPWAVFYRKSVWEEKGYEVPATLDELKTLGAKMKADGLAPIAFADKDGWPAMGTFDILNLRINGYDFHMQLMKGEASWQDPKVVKVFETWRELLPLHQEGSLGRTWQEAAQSVATKKAGMYFLGMFVGQQFEGANRDDLDFFNFPEIDSTIGADTLDAPIDGFMLSKKPENEDGAKALMKYLASAAAQGTYLQSDPNNIATANDADTNSYSALQKKAVELINGASNITQFMDRDTRPDFASTVMIPSLQDFIKNPDDVAGLTKKIEDQKKTIFT